MSENVSRKITLKEIEKLAACLPIITRLTNERHWVDGAELIAQGHTEEGGQKVIAGRQYEQRMPVVIALNHKRNMKKIHKEYGDRGILEYVNEVQAHKILNDKLNGNARETKTVKVKN